MLRGTRPAAVSSPSVGALGMLVLLACTAVPTGHARDISVAVAVMSSDTRADVFAGTIARTWASTAHDVVLFVDTSRYAEEWALRSASDVQLRRSLTVAPCCPGNESLGLSIASAQYKLEHTFARMLTLTPGRDFYLFTDDDTYWNMPLLHARLGSLDGVTDPARPTALFPGRTPAAMGAAHFCPTSGPFMLMNARMVELLATPRVMGACRQIVIDCYDTYRRREADPRVPLGVCPIELAPWDEPYSGALYNNDHLINMCVHASRRAGAADAVCLPGYEFDMGWAMCGHRSPYAKKVKPPRKWSCEMACNRTSAGGVGEACTVEVLFRKNLEVSAGRPIFMHNQHSTPPRVLAKALHYGETLTYGHAPCEPSRTSRLLSNVMAWHHVQPDGMRWLHRLISGGELPDAAVVAGSEPWVPRSLGAAPPPASGQRPASGSVRPFAVTPPSATSMGGGLFNALLRLELALEHLGLHARWP